VEKAEMIQEAGHQTRRMKNAGVFHFEIMCRMSGNSGFLTIPLTKTLEE
jgi:hypothetical protein